MRGLEANKDGFHLHIICPFFSTIQSFECLSHEIQATVISIAVLEDNRVAANREMRLSFGVLFGEQIFLECRSILNHFHFCFVRMNISIFFGNALL